MVCVLLSVLWVRSYSIWEVVYVRSSKTIAYFLISSNGHLVAQPAPTMPTKRNFVYSTGPASGNIGNPFVFGFARQPVPYATAPHWFVFLAAGAFTFLPWLRWRFSLRTLLVATTLVGLILGLLVYALK